MMQMIMKQADKYIDLKGREISPVELTSPERMPIEDNDGGS